MRIIGLTGGIGMGKSTVGGGVSACPGAGVRCGRHGARAAGRAVAVRSGLIGLAFPGTIRAGAVDRAALRAIGPYRTRPPCVTLERILHPMVRAAERAFLARARRAGRPAVVLDIPLLLETGGERRVDIVLVVSAPRAVQRARVRARRRMTESQIDAIMRRQMPDAEKRRRADIVIRTGLSRHYALSRLRRFIEGLYP